MTAIKADESYLIEDFLSIVKLGRNALREAERGGLKTCFVGVRKYIRGSAWLDYLAAQESKPAPNRGQRTTPRQKTPPTGRPTRRSTQAEGDPHDRGNA